MLTTNLGIGSWASAFGDPVAAAAMLDRDHPTLPPGTSCPMRVEHHYHRGGALAYLSVYDVHRAKVARPLRAHHRHHPVHGPGRTGHDARSPHASAKRGVLDRVDNGLLHEATAAAERLAEAHPSAVMVHTPR